MAHSGIVVNVSALNVEKMRLDQEIDFSIQIHLAKGINKVSFVYPFSVEILDHIEIRVRVTDISTKKDLLRCFPRIKYGETPTFYIDATKEHTATLTYFVKKSSEDLGNKSSVILSPNVNVKTLVRLQDYVDQSFIINLKSREDKLQKITARFDYHDISYEIFEAVDGRVESEYKQWFRKVSTKTRSSLENKLGRPELYYCGAWGYNETYIKILQTAIKRNLKSIAIFDDDVILHNDFILEFDNLVREPKVADANLIYLGCRFIDKPKNLPTYVTEDLHIVGSYAIIIKAKAYQRVLDALLKREHVVDGYPLRQLFDKGEALALRDALVLPECTNGDIRADRDTQRIYADQGWDNSQFGGDVYSRQSYEFTEMKLGEFSEVASYAVLGIKCKNRVDYLKALVDSFIQTKSPKIGFRLYVADTSTDLKAAEDIREYLENLDIPNTSIGYLKFCDASVTDLSNGILSEVLQYDLRYNPYIFMCDEDVVFLNSGWDIAYIKAMSETEYKHLVLHDSTWRKGTQKHMISAGVGNRINLISHVDYMSAQGAFFTLTSKVLKEVGLYNRALFPTKGGGHLNYTYRIYRHLGLDTNLIRDIQHSEKLIRLQPKDSYVSTGSTLSLYHQVRVNSQALYETFKDRIENEDSNFELYTRI